MTERVREHVRQSVVDWYAAGVFEESALAWSGADLFRYDVTADGQRFIAVKPEARERAPLQLVVIPQFMSEVRARLTGR